MPNPLLVLLTVGLTICVTSCDQAPTGQVAQCANCTVEFGEDVPLHGTTDVEAAINARIRQDRRGRLFVAPLIDQTRVGVFAADGRFIRTLGRRGRGPGEFVEVRDVQVGRGDTLYVLHDESISLFGPDSLQYVRSASSSAAGMATFVGVLSDGSAITARTSTTHGAPAEDLIRIHRVGVVEPELGGLTTTDTATAALFVRNDTIWLLRRDYRLFMKAPKRDWVALLAQPQWFAAELRAAQDEKRGPPRLTDLFVGDDGRILILASVSADEPDRARAVPVRGEGPARQVTVSEWQSRRHPRLEVWDADGTLHASMPVPASVARFVDHEHVTQFAEDSLGNTLVSIRRFRVTDNK